MTDCNVRFYILIFTFETVPSSDGVDEQNEAADEDARQYVPAAKAAAAADDEGVRPLTNFPGVFFRATCWRRDTPVELRRRNTINR